MHTTSYYCTHSHVPDPPALGHASTKQVEQWNKALSNASQKNSRKPAHYTVTGAQRRASQAMSSCSAEARRLWAPLLEWPPAAHLMFHAVVAATEKQGEPEVADTLAPAINPAELGENLSAWAIAPASRAVLLRLRRCAALVHALQAIERCKGSPGYSPRLPLALAYAALAALRDEDQQQQQEQQQQSALVQGEEAVLWSAVFRHALELRCHTEAFAALCANPDVKRRKVSNTVLFILLRRQIAVYYY
jgi:hypothetical protein